LVLADPQFDFKHPVYTPIIKERMRRLQRLRDEPALVGHLLRVYKDAPWLMIVDWGVTFDPRNVERGLPASIPFLLFPKQVEWCQWAFERWKAQEPGITDKSRDLGMSWCAIGMACALAITHDGFTAGFGSRKEEYVDKIGSPKALFWKARKFLENLPRELRAGHDPRQHAPHLRLTFPRTGSVITGEAGDNIGRGDRASIYFVDESAHLERPMLIEASLSATTNCRIDISSANGMGNPFAQKRHSWPERQIFTLHWRDDPRKDDVWYAKQIAQLDPVTVAQEIDIDYAAAVEGVIIPSAWVQAAVDAHIALGLDDSGERTAAFDVADEGADKNAFISMKGMVIDVAEEWSGKNSDIFHSVQKVFGFCDDIALDGFLYDADGMGAGVRGDARAINDKRRALAFETGKPPRLVNPSPFWGSGAVERPDSPFMAGADRTNGDYYANRKAQNWGVTMRRFRETYRARTEPGYKYDSSLLISISSKIPSVTRTKLLSELSQPTWERNMVGKMVVDKKPDGSKSPNLADGVMMVAGGGRRRMRISDEAANRR
jgi:phage terminase large subunit